MKKIKSQIINYKDPTTKKFVPFSAIGNPFKKLIDFLNSIIDVDRKDIYIKDENKDAISISTTGISINDSMYNAYVSIDTGDVMLSDQEGYISLRELNNTANDLKKSVSDGKEMLAESITNKGIDTASTDSFSVMADNISNIVTSTKNTIAITDKSTISVGNAETIATYEKVYSYYYNGVNLPKLPDGVLDKYPYVFIRKMSSNYQLCCNDTQVYLSTDHNYFICEHKPYNYIIYTASEGDMEWNKSSEGIDNTDYSYVNGAIWTNTDIHVGSIDGAEIYLQASEIERR